MPKAKFTIPPIQTAKPITGVDKEVLSKTIDDGVYPLAMAKEIRLDRIQPDPNQPRRSFDQERLEELAASIHEQGILQPIVVEYIDDGNYFRLIHGERRWRAAALAGLQTIPAIIRKVDDNTRLVRQLIENIQREDLNDVDRARALQQLKANLGSPSWDVVAQKVGISKRRVLQLVDITKLPDTIQENIRSGELTEKHGRAARMLPHDRQVEFAEKVRAEQLSGDESLEVAKALKSEPALPIDQAIAQIKQKQAANRAARSSNRPSPKPAAAPQPEIIRFLTEQPTPTSTITQPDDPLTVLRGVPKLIASCDLAQLDHAQMRYILQEIIDAAQTALAKLDAPS